MISPNVKEVVREKYGQAALRVRQAPAIPAVATVLPPWKAPVLQ